MGDDERLWRSGLVVWTKFAGYGSEISRIRIGPDGLRARGTAIVASPEPFEMRYDVATTAEYLTRRLLLRCRGFGWSRRLVLDRNEVGEWSAGITRSGTRVDDAQDAGVSTLGADVVDVDLESSPLFNTIPVLRHDLLRRGRSATFPVAWIAIPSLTIHRSVQRYRTLGPDGREHVIRFETVEQDGFVADIRVDADGIVTDYPGIARREPSIAGSGLSVARPTFAP